ncbi:MAG: hypothetical protein KDA75_09080 [Planctomycetaceae bacterium]|nr:hypothetical protein [Planctomycetaceae bacterium]
MFVRHQQLPSQPQHRRGAFMILAVVCLMMTIAFVAFSVDLGFISLTRSQMQSAADAAALAAVMEITHAVETAPPEAADIVAYAKDEAADKAAEVAQLNGFYVDASTDVAFGSRTFDESSGEYAVDWSIGWSDPANVIKVTIRKDDPDVTQPDGQLRLFFGGVFGSQSAVLQANSTAFVEARDMVVVHDFSRSMNFDSQFSDETAYTPADSTVVANMQALWDDLQPLNLGTMGFTPQYMTLANADPSITVGFAYSQVQVATAETLKEVKLQFTNGNQQTFTASGSNGTYAGTGGNNGRNISTVWVTVTVEEGNGPQPATVNQSSPTRTTEFSGDRETVTIDSNSSWSRVELEFEDGSSQTIYDSDNHETYSGTGGNSGKKIAGARIRVSGNWKSWANSPSVTYGPVTSDETHRFDDTDNNVKAAFGLNNVAYPYPSGSWDSYISFVRNNAKLAEKGYAECYGGLTFVNYLLHEKSSHSETPALAAARHYPFPPIKRGHLLLCDFLEDLGFNDYLGMVSYDSYHRIEDYQSEPGVPLIDIRSDRLGTNYSDVANLMRYKQANHYYPATNIGGGMREAIALLDAEKRAGARPNIILMTDGNANTTDGSTTLPSGWESWFNDYDGPGTTYSVNHDNPSSSIRTARYSLIHEVHDAVTKGYTIHTIAVGSDADWRTMKAVAHYGKGQFLYVPGGTSTEEMEANLMAAFHRIAGLVPPAKLLKD